MLLILLILIAIGYSIWLYYQGYSFFGNAVVLCTGAILVWLIILLVITCFLPHFTVENEIHIDGYHLDSSFPLDYLSYFHDGKCYRVSGQVSIFYGGPIDTLIISDNYIDVPDWFWLISFMDISNKPWNTDYFIR